MMIDQGTISSTTAIYIAHLGFKHIPLMGPWECQVRFSLVPISVGVWLLKKKKRIPLVPGLEICKIGQLHVMYINNTQLNSSSLLLKLRMNKDDDWPRHYKQHYCHLYSQLGILTHPAHA